MLGLALSPFSDLQIVHLCYHSHWIFVFNVWKEVVVVEVCMGFAAALCAAYLGSIKGLARPAYR